MHVTAGNIITHLYYAVAADGRLLILSNFNEDFMSVAGLCANIGLGKYAYFRDGICCNHREWEVYRDISAGSGGG